MSTEKTFPDALIDEIKASVDIVEFIAARTTIKKTGANYSGLCPFHEEKTPSFTVSPTKQFYHCFGCGAHGDVIKWLEEKEGLSFVEAVKDLAKRAGIALPERRTLPADRAREDLERPIFDALAAAQVQFAADLKSDRGRAAREYLSGRGFTEETIDSFEIGYATGELPVHNESAQIQAGVLVRADEGKPARPFFWSRIMFPVRDRRGRLIGFGGRTLGDSQPKYLNTPETPVYDKSRALYGIALALPAIRHGRHAIVVEGYLDTAMLHQHGICNVVAGCGTAVTDRHLKILFGLAPRITFAFDGDKAGRQAALRVIDRLLPTVDDSHTIDFVFLPEGEDPDSFVQGNGAEAFQARLRNAVPLSKILCKRFTPAADSSLEDRVSLSKQAVRELGGMAAAPTLRALLMKEASRTIGVDIALPTDPTSASVAGSAKANPDTRTPQQSPTAQRPPSGTASDPVQPERTRGAPYTAQPNAVVMQHVVAPVLRYLLAFPETVKILPPILQQQPIIAALCSAIAKHPDLEHVSEAVRFDKTLAEAVKNATGAAIARRDISNPQQAMIDAQNAFEVAAGKFRRLDPSLAAAKAANYAKNDVLDDANDTTAGVSPG